MQDHVLFHLCDAEGELPIKYQSFEIAEIECFVSDYLPLEVDPGTKQWVQDIDWKYHLSRVVKGFCDGWSWF